MMKQLTGKKLGQTQACSMTAQATCLF